MYAFPLHEGLEHVRLLAQVDAVPRFATSISTASPTGSARTVTFPSAGVWLHQQAFAQLGGVGRRQVRSDAAGPRGSRWSGSPSRSRDPAAGPRRADGEQRHCFPPNLAASCRAPRAGGSEGNQAYGRTPRCRDPPALTCPHRRRSRASRESTRIRYYHRAAAHGLAQTLGAWWAADRRWMGCPTSGCPATGHSDAATAFGRRQARGWGDHTCPPASPTRRSPVRLTAIVCASGPRSRGWARRSRTWSGRNCPAVGAWPRAMFEAVLPHGAHMMR